MFSQIFRISLLFLIIINANVLGQKRYFYTNKEYGSEALFNPLTLLINGGYDITQLQSVSNKIDNPNFSRMLNNVLGNLGDPFPRIRKYGTWKFFRQELLPLGVGADNMQWAPNYQQHLIGCGMLYTEMKEWYEDKNFPMPWLFSSVTLMSQHLLNEVMETGPLFWVFKLLILLVFKGKEGLFCFVICLKS
jgi:hypothetical protein